MRNARFWRLAVITFTAAGLSLAGAGTALAGASGRSQVTVTIGTASSFVPVDGSTMVRWGGPAAGTAATATVSGTITGLPAGLGSVVVTLQDEPFGAASFTSTGKPVTIPAGDGTADYSFPVTPDLATGYQVEVSPAAGASLLATSAARTVYVIPQVTAVTTACTSRPLCTGVLTVTARFPTSSTFANESAKHLYLYSGIRHSATTTPAAPAALGLTGYATSVTTNPARQTVRYTAGFTFDLGTAGYQWKINYCTQDSESLDGIGLPGHHGCGNVTVSTTAPYLG